MRREYLWALLTLVIAIALALILLSVAKDESQSATRTDLPPLPKCIDRETQAEIKRMTSRAVDQGYQRHVGHLFDILMGTPNAEQYNRARTGMQNGIKGFLLAQESIDLWIPPLCPEQK